KDKELADPDLKKAYERRLEIGNQFLNLMRDGYRRYKQTPPFDRGEKAEPAGTVTKKLPDKKAGLAPVPPALGSETQWPRFRGPSGQGDTNAQSLPLTWDKSGKNILWRTKVPGRGNSSPIVWAERIFLTTADAKGAERSLLCFDRRDGRLWWSRTAPAKPPEPVVREKNGYASATPVTDGERVISFLGSCGLACYDFDGKLQWTYDGLRFSTTHGTGSSPLLYKDLVILVHDQNLTDSVFVALDKRSGKLVWQQKRGRAMGWSTPVVVR